MIINLHNLYLSWRHIPVYSTSFKLVVTVTRRDRSDRSHDSDGGRRGCLKLPYDCHGGSHAMARIGTTCHNHGTIMAQCSRMYLNRVMIEATIAAAKQRITVYNHTPSRRRRLTARETPWHGAWDAVSLRRESRRRLTTRAMSLGAYSPRKSPTGPDGRESLAPLRLGPPWVCGWSVQCLWHDSASMRGRRGNAQSSLIHNRLVTPNFTVCNRHTEVEFAEPRLNAPSWEV